MKILNLLSITQAALVFDNFDHLDNLGVNFDSDYSLLDRVAREAALEMEIEGSGEDAPLAPTQAPKMTQAVSSDMTAVADPHSTKANVEVLEDSTEKESVGVKGVGVTDPTPSGNTTAPSNTTVAPEPEPEGGAAAQNLASALLCALISYLLL